MRFPLNNITRLIIGLFLIFTLSLSYAGQGCCSHHGGIAGCNRSNNRELCKDGTTSPTCPCTTGTSSSSWWNSKTTTTKPPKTTTTSTKPTTTTETTSTTTSTTTEKQRGCCSRHGGVVGCKNGYALCKDKSVSTSCKC